MQYIIYWDQILVLLIGMHICLFELTAFHMKSRINTLRLILVSIGNSVVFIFILFMLRLPMWMKVCLLLFVCDLLACQLVFRFRNMGGFLRGFWILHEYGFVIAGILLAWQRMMKDRITGGFAGIYGGAQIAVIAGMLHLFQKLCRGYQERNTHIIEMEIDFFGKKKKLAGLIDTGNCLYDPYLHRPVIIINQEAIQEELSKASDANKILIPFHSIGKSNGMLEAVEIPEIRLLIQGERKKLKHVIAAISREPVSIRNQYDVILHPALITVNEAD